MNVRVVLAALLLAGFFIGAPTRGGQGIRALAKPRNCQEPSSSTRRERKLFFVLGGDKAIAYPVGVPRRGAEWSGTASVNGKFVRPDWIPPSEVRIKIIRPKRVKGGASNNPMGARAITLDRSDIAIHGRPSACAPR